MLNKKKRKAEMIEAHYAKMFQKQVTLIDNLQAEANGKVKSKSALSSTKNQLH